MSSQDLALGEKYDIVKHRIISSTQISDRTATIVSKLGIEKGHGEKPTVICLTAPAKVATKLISIVEIAKRELVAKQIQYYQYNALSSHLLDVPREQKKGTAKDDADHSDTDVAFETMGGSDGGTKKRNVPVMTIYLSRVPIKELRAEYGEQVQIH